MSGSKDDWPSRSETAQYLETVVEKKAAITDVRSATESKKGDKFHLVAARWWKQWPVFMEQAAADSRIVGKGYIYCSYSSYQTEASHEIEETSVVIKLRKQDNLELQDLSSENNDYVLLPEAVWKDFYKWYEGGHSLTRKDSNENADIVPVNIYSLRIGLVVSSDASQLIVRVSSQGSSGELYQRAQALGSEKIRIWDCFGKIKDGMVKDCDQSLEVDADVEKSHEILLEVQLDDRWSDGNRRSSFEGCSLQNGVSLSTGEPSTSSFSMDNGPLLDGLTGLQNLGNTCFMNSALQCLVHTPQLAEFFLQDYRKQINELNPLGMKGELAIAFGELLRNLWASGRQPVAPRTFKANLARFAPQFSGYNQHDSQELLAFLLDGLHEDLNRVKRKPYVESKDSNGRPDDEVADEYWENHKARNDSIIVDICQGQYKSTLVCPECSKVSVTFDPFMYLSLPLPSITTQTLTVRLFTCDGSKPPLPYTVTIPKPGRRKDLLAALNKACNLESGERLLLTELYSHRQFKILEDHIDFLSPVRENDHITAHKLSESSDQSPLLVFVNRRLAEDSISHRQSSFGSPLIASLPDDGLKTGEDLLGLFKNLVCRLSKVSPSLQRDHSESGVVKSDFDDLFENDSSLSKTLGSIAVDGACNVCKTNGHSQPMFQLYLVEDKLLDRELPIELGAPLPAAFDSARTNSRIHIAVNWSEKALTNYDIQQLGAMPEILKQGHTLIKPQLETVSLYSCLEAFLKEEPLGPEDMWYCPCCKEHRQASKKLDLWRLPEILVVHLKRFSFSRYFKNKLETYVNFPIHDLDLSKYVRDKDSACYELYAVSNHYGSMGGGHYTAYVKLLAENRWYNFDDSHVSPVGEEEVKTAAAYVLFYRRIRRAYSPALTNGAPCHERSANQS